MRRMILETGQSPAQIREWLGEDVIWYRETMREADRAAEFKRKQDELKAQARSGIGR
jgi:hypothetical protein